MLVEVDPGKQTPEYVNNFVTNSTKRAYLPLMLWAMHEYLFLTELSKSASGWVDFRKTKEEHMIVLRNFRARIYNYRFHFRFSHASAISMHNDMFRLWRKTYDLGTILDEVDRDVAETDNNLESFYTERARSKQERSRLIFGLFLAVAGTVISIPDWINRRMSDIVPVDCCGRFSWLCWDFSLHYIIVGLFLLSFAALGLLADCAEYILGSAPPENLEDSQRNLKYEDRSALSQSVHTQDNERTPAAPAPNKSSRRSSSAAVQHCSRQPPAKAAASIQVHRMLVDHRLRRIDNGVVPVERKSFAAVVKFRPALVCRCCLV